ncbi:MAG: peptidoglycan-binding domain-containing protein [Desulfobacterales bacterium]
MQAKQNSVWLRGIILGSALMLMSAPAAFAQQQTGTTKKSPTTMDSQKQTMHGTTSQSGMHKGAAQGENMDSSMMQNVSSHQKMSKQEVKSAQQALNNEGYTLSEDGVMGKNTQKAIEEYQKKNNLKQTGRLDAETMSKLNLK